MTDLLRIRAKSVSVALDLAVRHVRDFAAEHWGRTLRPLHTAPWVEDPAVAADGAIPPIIRRLSGDFFCAPFSDSDVVAPPPHGWSANSRWRHEATRRAGDAVTARFRLERSIMGAALEKSVTLRDGHPFLYQEHVFRGGEGRLPVGNHAVTRFGPASGRLSSSPLACAETPAEPLERDPPCGPGLLVYPARITDLHAAPCAGGGVADLTRYPSGARHEDFVTLVDAPGTALGWTAALRLDARDVVLSLGAHGQLPVTMLWFSNGGWDYAPRNGRHTGVLGIEQGRSFGPGGHAASAAANALSDAGVPTALTLRPDSAVAIRDVIGAAAAPEGFGTVADVAPAEGALRIADETGAVIDVPFDRQFLRG